jgi:type IV pilus assembly protein PilV
MRNTLHSRRRRQARGYMLIEVLVSFLIFSVGVLALVGLQARMGRAQTAAKARADASYLANELVGVMWSDMSHLSSYSACASYARCLDWQNKVAASLPAGTGTVVSVDAATGAVSIQIQWRQGSDDTHTYTTTARVLAS